MIIGIGHDICDQRRIGAIFDRFGMRLSARILTQEEQTELKARKNKHAYLAGRFAVKEAVYKALAAADQAEMRWHHAATLSSKNGSPQLILSDACLAGAKTLLPPGHGLKLHVSLSDEPPYSSAFVVLSAEQETE